jgi:hypothetical protein
MTYEDYVKQGRHYTFPNKSVELRGRKDYPHYLLLDDRMIHQPTQIEEPLPGLGKENRPDQTDQIVCFELLKKKVTPWLTI